MPEPVQSTLLAGERVEMKDALHGAQRSVMENSQVRIAGECERWKNIPPHIAHAVERPGIYLAQMRQMWGAARLEQLFKEWRDRLDAADAFLNRHRGRAKPSAVTGSHRVDKVSQTLGDLAVGERFQCWLGIFK